MKKIISICLLLLVGSTHAQTQRLINTRDMYPSVSADGTKLVFQSNRSGSNQIFIMNVEGGEIRQLGDFPLGAETPVFSPDGRRIAFASNRSGPAPTGQIWLMNSDGTGLQQLSKGPWSHAQPAWAFDGQAVYAYQLSETANYEFGSIVSIKVTE